jgi:hypothetical protein
MAIPATLGDERWPIDTAAQRWAFTEAEMGVIVAAYDLLTRKGNEGADDGVWEPLLDRAHHGLGIIQGLVAAETVRRRRDV